VDSYSIAYTDPWFDPDFLSSLLHDRTQYQSQAAYIEENQGLYQLHRRRVQNSLQWNVSPQVSILLGHRWERVDVAAAKGYNVDSGQLALLARYPAYALISAPFIQVARDTRDNSFDPTTGSYSAARLDFANQFFFTSPNASFVKVDLRHQWTWPVGYKARAGVLAFGVHLGAAKPTASTANDLPLSERFFAGGPFSFRGVEPDALGHQIYIPQRDQFGNVITDSNGNPLYYATPTGGQGLVLLSLEYRFPFIGQSVWGELFVDSGQVYENLSRSVAPPPATTTGGSGSTSAVNVPTDTASPYPPLRTAPGLGLIFKIGIPLKVEYAADIRRILGQPRSQADRDTQLHSLLISAGFTF
jgi:outer membrane protein assembly factor BamA